MKMGKEENPTGNTERERDERERERESARGRMPH